MKNQSLNCSGKKRTELPLWAKPIKLAGKQCGSVEIFSRKNRAELPLWASPFKLTILQL